MICDKCGSKIGDNEIYCPVCNSKLNKTDNNYVKKNKGSRNKRIIPIILAVIVIGGGLFYSSDSGKLFIASFYAKHGYYNRAIDKVYNIGSDKADVRNDYYSLLLKMDNFVNNSVDIKENESGDDKCTMSLLNDIIDSAESIRERKSKLAYKEQMQFDNILSSLNKYHECSDDFDDFEKKLYNAYDIYSLAEFFASGREFNAAEKLKEVSVCRDNLEKAKEIYKKYAYEGLKYVRAKNGRYMDTRASDDGIFVGYDGIKNTIDDLTSSMNSLISKYGEDEDRICYTEFSYPKSPYDRMGMGINNVINDIKLKVAKEYFEEVVS